MIKEGYVTIRKDLFDRIDENYQSDMKNGIIVYETPEDSLRFFKIDDEKVTVKVQAEANYDFNSEFYGYNNMFCTNNIKILEVVTREEMIKKAFTLSPTNVERIIRGIKLSEEEKKELSKRGEKISSYIDYYQNNNLEAFENDTKVLVKSKIKNNG